MWGLFATIGNDTFVALYRCHLESSRTLIRRRDLLFPVTRRGGMSNCWLLLWTPDFTLFMHPPLIGGGIKQYCCLTSVCLSVAYIGPKWRTERPRKTKIGTEVYRPHHTWLGHHFQGQKVKVQLVWGQKSLACAHILLCFALLSQCRLKLGKIAQCLFFRDVVVCILANSVVNCSLWRFSYLQLIMTCRGRGHIVSPRAQLVKSLLTRSTIFRFISVFLFLFVLSFIWLCGWTNLVSWIFWAQDKIVYRIVSYSLSVTCAGVMLNACPQNDKTLAKCFCC